MDLAALDIQTCKVGICLTFRIKTLFPMSTIKLSHVYNNCYMFVNFLSEILLMKSCIFQANEKNSILIDLSIFLEAFNTLFILKGKLSYLLLNENFCNSSKTQIFGLVICFVFCSLQ